uniref:Ig-like domain-containing protein n=1 Tax=Glossina pallidipes TaxID=7398 RepID=A0A1B0AIM1_GLOPL
MVSLSTASPFVETPKETCFREQLQDTLDKPICRPDQKKIYGVARNEAAEISCEVDAFPPPENFKWSFNNTAETFDMPQSGFRAHSAQGSTLTYTPVKISWETLSYSQGPLVKLMARSLFDSYTGNLEFDEQMLSEENTCYNCLQAIFNSNLQELGAIFHEIVRRLKSLRREADSSDLIRSTIFKQVDEKLMSNPIALSIRLEHKLGSKSNQTPFNTFIKANLRKKCFGHSTIREKTFLTTKR